MSDGEFEVTVTRRHVRLCRRFRLRAGKLRLRHNVSGVSTLNRVLGNRFE